MRLPTATINGQEWFIDRRLLQLRAVDNPHRYMDFGDELEMEEYMRDQAKAPPAPKRKRVTLCVDVSYDDVMTSPDGLCDMAERLLETALSTPGITSEYGDLGFGCFYYEDGTVVDA
jgi:hypothetical protein